MTFQSPDLIKSKTINNEREIELVAEIDEL